MKKKNGLARQNIINRHPTECGCYVWNIRHLYRGANFHNKKNNLSYRFTCELEKKPERGGKKNLLLLFMQQKRVRLITQMRR